MKNSNADKTYLLKSQTELFDVALNMFSSHSFDLSSLNDIIKQSNSNKGSFYYRFPDKKSLYFSLIDDLFNQQNIIFTDQISVLSSISNIRQMTTMVYLNSLRLFQIDHRYLDLFRMVYHEPESLIEEIHTNCISSLYQKYLDYISTHFSKEKLCNASELGATLNYLSFIYTNLEFILEKNFTEVGISTLVSKIFDGISPSLSTQNSIPLVKLTDVSFSFPEKANVLDTISLECKSNEILAIVGPSRAGKSTFQRLMANLYRANVGSVEYLSENNIQTRLSNDELGFTFDKPCLFSKMTIRQNLLHYAHAFKRKVNLPELLDSLQMSGFANIKIENLTEAQKIKVNFLRSIINEPKILLLDDVMKGLSDEDQQLIFQIMLKIRASGSTIVMTTSRMSEALSFADRIGFLVNGKIVSIRNTIDLKNKYQGKSYIVEYKEAELVNTRVFSELELKQNNFTDLIRNKDIISISTKAVLDNEIFKNETGVEL